MNQKIYLCGNIAGNDYSTNFNVFAKAESSLKSIGFDVLNPVKHFSKYAKKDVLARTRIAMLSEADAVYLMEGFNQDPLSGRELLLAVDLNLSIYSHRDNDHLLNRYTNSLKPEHNEA